MNENINPPEDQEIISAIKRLRDHDAPGADQLRRARDLKSIDARIRGSKPKRSLFAAAAAVALVLGTGVLVSVTSSNDSATDLADSQIETPELKPVDFVTEVPFERDEDYVMISVESSRVDQIGKELEAVSNGSVSVVGENSDRTTFVVPASAAGQLSDTTGMTVIADTPMKSIAEQSPVPSWGLDRIDAFDVALNDSYRYVSTGAGSLIYVIDTGVYSGHGDLSGRVIKGYTAINDGNGTEDCNGHGTHVAGTAAGKTYGVAKSATIVAVRVLDCNGSGYSSSVVAGINWAVASHPGGPGVINLSLGGLANSAVDAAVADATAAGLVVVVAAGNSSADACQYSPSRAPSALTIGATDRTDLRASYSNFGSCVDMYAPGTSITSAWISGSTSTRTISGTSMAAPHVAGLAARLQQAQPGIGTGGIAQTLTGPNVGDGTVTIANFVEEETPVESTTTSSVPVESTTTTIATPGPTTTIAAPTTTVAPRPGNSGSAPGGSRAPGRNRSVPQPKEFAFNYEDVDGTRNLLASWIDDGTPESYVIECNRLSGPAIAPATTTFVVERAATVQVAGGRTQTTMVLTPSESMRCWVIAFIGETRSAQSSPANLIVSPASRPTPPNNRNNPTGSNNPSNPDNAGNGNSGNQGNSGRGNTGNKK